MADFLLQARNGSSLLITSLDEVLAETHSSSTPSRLLRQPGTLRGKIRLAPDFDALSPDVLAAMRDEEADIDPTYIQVATRFLAARSL